MLRRLALLSLACLLAACATANRVGAANDIHALLTAIRDDDRAAFDARVDRDALKAEMSTRALAIAPPGGAIAGYSDGSALGNPGPTGAGFVVK